MIKIGLTAMLLALTMFMCKGHSEADRNNEETIMDSIQTLSFLPFGIETEEDVKQIEILLAFYSGKTGAGKQEIILKGDGTLKLFYSKSFQDKNPKILEAECPVPMIIRLLDLMEGAGLFGLPDTVSSEGTPHARRLLRVTLPNRTKLIALDEPGNYSIEQMLGAVKMVAGQCAPEALNHRFFPNL